MVGRSIGFEALELGIDGDAIVKAIEPCPPIARGNGPLVTCTFETTGQEVWAVGVEGESKAIRCTGGHQFYSVDRETFVPAAELVAGETLWTPEGLRRVVGVAATTERATVYNFEVSGVHRYLVGYAGVLVHNACPQGGVYALVTNTGKVVRTGKTMNLARRELEHARTFKGLRFVVLAESNDRHLRRGLEQLAHERFAPILNKIRPMRIDYPDRDRILENARKFWELNGWR